MSNDTKKLVYSTDTGDLRKHAVTTPHYPALSRPVAQQSVTIRHEKSGRKGKIVTIIVGFILTENDLHELSKTLKTLCGAGGTIKVNDDNSQVIEIQGDHRAKIATKLQALGYKVKGSF